MGIALDSTFFIDLQRARPSALRKLEEIEARPDLKVIPTPVAFEILSGIVKARGRSRSLVFRSWVSRFHLAPLDLPSAERAAWLRAEFEDLGRAKGTVDLLTAGIALSGGHTLLSRDRDFFEIAEATGLLVEGY